MHSPPVQPISSSRSGTGSVTTMCEEVAVSAWRRPRTPSSAPPVASRACLARSSPPGHRHPYAPGLLPAGAASACARGSSRRRRAAGRAGRRRGGRDRRSPPPGSRRRRESGASGSAPRPARPRARRPRRSRQAAAARRTPAPSCRPGPSRSRPAYSRRAGNDASTSCSSHHSPIAVTERSAARQTASAASSPKRATSAGRLNHIELQKPPLRPLGPRPQISASIRVTVGAGRELLQPPGRPHPGVAAADHGEVGAVLALQRRQRLGGWGGRDPVPVCVVTHPLAVCLAAPDAPEQRSRTAASFG